TTFNTVDNLFSVVQNAVEIGEVHCVMVDEAQFLTTQQVKQLSNVADELEIPVLAYGLRVDFQGNLFEGSQQLLAWADTMTEIKTICHCGRKATMVLRVDEQGDVIRAGNQVQIGGNERYISVCRRHFKSGMAERSAAELPFEEE
ncbi:MAG: thymidine kinase, partial [Planctomycetota bacterium]